MSFIDWPGDLGVGIADIDRDHEQLVRIVNDLHELVSSDAPGRDTASLLLALVRHTQDHFRREEELMLRHGYPAAAEHAREHGELLNVFSHLLGAMGTEQARLDGGALAYIRRWLCGHIENSDAALARFVGRKTGA